VYNVGLIRHPSGGVEEVAWSGWNLEVEVVLFGGASRWSTAMDMPLPHAHSSLELCCVSFPRRWPWSGGFGCMKLPKVKMLQSTTMAIAMYGGGSLESRIIDFSSAEGLLSIQGVMGGVAAAHWRHVLFIINILEI
jgi:hypothetical protein